jgi:hypothetical protein
VKEQGEWWDKLVVYPFFLYIFSPLSFPISLWSFLIMKKYKQGGQEGFSLVVFSS